MKDLVCIKCGKPRTIGRRICAECNKIRCRLASKKRNSEGKRTMYEVECIACKEVYTAFRKKPWLCFECRNLRKVLASEVKTTNAYLYSDDKSSYTKRYRHLHRKVAEDALGRELKSNEIVHHVNCNHLDNSKDNLMVMDRRTHTKLHNYLDTQRVIIEKSMNENPGNCWNNLIAPITTAWLETTSAKVIRIWEIGQSAAEPLSNKEGSETKLRTSDHLVEDEDIVQTTTITSASES